MYDEEIYRSPEIQPAPTLVLSPPDTPNVTDAVGIYLFSGVLLVVFGTLLQKLDLLLGLLVTEVVFLMSPPLLYALRQKYHLGRTFQFAPIPFRTVWLTPLTTAAAFVLIGVAAAGQELVFPRSQAYQELWEQTLKQFYQLPLFLTVAIVAILPGICEEVFFRGFLLRGLRQKYSDGAAILLVGVLFGIFHLDPYRFVPVTLLGVLFGYLVVRTGSIFTSMLAHVTNNTIAILLSPTAQSLSQRSFSPGASEQTPLFPLMLSLMLLIGIALTIFLAGLRAIPRSLTKSAAPGEKDSLRLDNFEV